MTRPDDDLRWDAYAEGRLPPHERADLEALAEADGFAAVLQELATPLDADRYDAFVLDVLAEGRSARARRRRWRGAVAAMAIAAGALVTIGLIRPGDLPTYTVADFTGATDGLAHPQDVVLELTPSRPHERWVRATLHIDEWSAAPLDLVPQQTWDGTLQFSPEVGITWALPSGAHRLLLEITPADGWPPWHRRQIFTLPYTLDLPDYRVALSGVRDMASGPSADPVLAMGDGMSLNMTPSFDPGGPVAVRVYLDALVPDARLDLPILAGPGGVLSVSAVVGRGAMAVSPGEHRLFLAIGPDAERPSPDVDASAWTVREVAFRVE